MFSDRQPRSFLEPAVLARLAGVPLLARKPMVGGVSGRHASPHRGSRVEFAEYRKYVPGDDLRRLDWRAFGRSDRFYVKEYEADTNLRLVIVLDTSGYWRLHYTHKPPVVRAADGLKPVLYETCLWINRETPSPAPQRVIVSSGSTSRALSTRGSGPGWTRS